MGGSVILDSGGQLSVGRNLAALTVGGNVQIDPGASGIVVGGELTQMTVNGFLRGQGSATAIDLGVGLNLRPPDLWDSVVEPSSGFRLRQRSSTRVAAWCRDR